MPPVKRRRRRPHGSARAATALAVIAGLAVSGCNKDSGDINRGQQLFVQRCGSCHILAAAGTQGSQGPSLDAAFAAARSRGMDADTVAGVVKAQVESPRPMTDNPSVSMPAELAEGKDLDDIAAYVGSVAGTGAKPPNLTPEQLFASSCGSCHTLAAAGTAGTTGPNLDEALSKDPKSFIEQSILDPSKEIAQGYADAMPATFGQSIKPADLTALVNFIYDSVHTGK
jgi:mono/diheme cytochrome c family protein